MTAEHKLPLVDLKEQRSKFPALKNKHYLNFGAQGTMPDSSIAAIRSAYDYLQEHGPLSASMFAWIQQQVSNTKELFAGEFGGAADSYALTQSATDGCNIVLWGLDWNPGDCLLTTDSEHNGVMLAAEQLCRRQRLTLEICRLSQLQAEDEILAAVEQALACKPRLFMLSHVLWNTGKVLPLARIAELCKSLGVLLLVDGAQSVGVMPLDMSDLQADFYAFTGHKWLCGPEGIGGLYVAPDSLAYLEPTFAGWRSAVFDAAGKPLDWAPGASRFEVATAPFPLLAGVAESIKVHRSFATKEERHRLVVDLAEALRTQLRAMPGLRLLDETGGSSLVSFSVEGKSHSLLSRKLEEQGVVLRTIPGDPDCIRASVHYFSADDVAALLLALRGILSS